MTFTCYLLLTRYLKFYCFSVEPTGGHPHGGRYSMSIQPQLLQDGLRRQQRELPLQTQRPRQSETGSCPLQI